MTEYHCPSCFEKYSPKEYDELNRREVDPDSDLNTGYERVCECGAGFSTDGWSLRDKIWGYTEEYGEEGIGVYTYALTVSHGPDNDQFFETLIDGVHDRYETKEEAIEGHERIVDKLQSGEYHYKVVSRRLVLNESE